MNDIMDFIVLMLKLSIPFTLAALAGTLSERSGTINLGLEGTMLIGSFAGAAGSGLTGNPWLGVLAALFAGCLIGLVHGLFCLTFRGHQIVVGVAINIFAGGITPLLCKLIWNKEGASETVPSITNMNVPILKDIPYFGNLFSGQTPFLFISIFIAILLSIFLYKTKYGFRLRMIGDNPMGVQAQGIPVIRYKYIALIVSGGIAALGGAYLSISQSNVFVLNMTAGRGYIGMAANIFGGWKIGGSVLASMFFATVQSTRFYLIDSSIPDQFIQMIPYAATLLALIFLGKNSKSPEGLGKVIN